MHWALAELPAGWFHHAEQVLALIEQHRPMTVVELGTHNGASAIAMARVVKQWGGIVYCVDTWAGVPGPGRSRYPHRIAGCATNMIRTKVNAHVRLIPANTADAAKAWRGPIDFLYVDADHSYEGCLADLEAWVPHVRRGGIIAGDDCDHPKFPGVRQAWELAARRWRMDVIFSPTADTTPPGMSLVYGVKR